MEILKIRPRTHNNDIRIISSKPNEKTRIASSNILNNINKLRPKSKNTIFTNNNHNLKDAENEKMRSSNGFTYVLNKEYNGDLNEVKKNTLKLLRDSKLSPFEKLDEYDKFKLRLKSSQGMKKILNLAINTNSHNELIETNKYNNKNVNTKKSSSRINIKQTLKSANKILKPFELEKENLDLLLFNEKNRIEFYQGIRKAKTSQIKFREKINLNEKLKKEFDKKTDILTLFDNVTQKEIPLIKTNLTTLSFNINKKIKAIRHNNKNVIAENLDKDLKAINSKENQESPLSKDTKETNIDRKDTDFMEINCDEYIKSNNNPIQSKYENFENENKRNTLNNLNQIYKRDNKSQKNNGVNSTNENKDPEIDKRKSFDELNTYLKLSCGFTPSKKLEKEKNKLLKILEAKKYTHTLEKESQQEMKDFINTECAIDEKFEKLVRNKLNEILLENFFNFGKYEKLKGHRRIQTYLDDEYKVPNMHSKLVFFQRIDPSSEQMGDNFIKEKIMSPNSLKNKVFEKLNEKRIFLKNIEENEIDDLPFIEKNKGKKNDISIISAENDPEKKFQKFKLSNFNMIGYLKNKYDNYGEIKFANERIVSNLNGHIKELVNAKRKRFILLSN